MNGDSENGTATANVKTIFGMPCQGCTDRAEIMGAGDWKVDAIVLGSLVFIVLGILLYKQSLTHE